MAMQYISHSDLTERKARIERVRQGIEDNKTEFSIRLTRITGDLDKGKGHVFSYKEPSFSQLLQRQNDNALVVSGRQDRIQLEETETSSPYSSAFSAPISVSTGFQVGPSSEGRVSGSLGQGKAVRRRPTSWRRKMNSRAPAVTEEPVDPVKERRQDVWDRLTDIGLIREEAWLLAEELIEVQTGRWNVERIHQLIHAEDVNLVLCTPVSRSRGDKIVWSFTRDGKYNTRSGYKLLETICHALFHCKAAKETWERSSIPLPPAGFSRNSIWKARNAFCFERVRYEAEAIVSKAEEDATIWTQLQRQDQEETNTLPRGMLYRGSWKPPPLDMVKCNVGASWRSGSQWSGAAWIIRDSQGQAISHSRRSYSAYRSATEAGLNALFWAVEAVKNMRMNKVILEVSSPEVYEMLTNPRHSSRRLAAEIALSVTRDTRLQSYVAHGGPTWLRTLILKEASVSATDDAS
ncbi:hypothetical protein DY000_02035364 [Brassica cretica]|uniref:RNase H type-1 domain-containing protein n=1 Tax=Brassica cretica TaxID=69181 RepID=A0ABQ7DWE8_BRACR|nr:hypothetical protein DY000_02035364 [Brassica cretica]